MDPITGFLINLLISFVLSAASTLLKQAFSSDQGKKTGTRGSVMIGGKVPQYFLIGTVAEPGKLEYRNSWGESDGVPNANVTDVRSFGDLPITGMTGLFINGIRRMPAGGAVEQGLPVALDGDGGTPHFWSTFLDGQQVSASSFLINKFGSDPDRPWAADMIGRGVPLLITTALWSETVWTGFPEVTAEFQGIKLYDPRRDSTRGGSGPQRWAGAVPTPEEQATWEFSDNNMVMIYNIERGIYYAGAHVWGGKKSFAELPFAEWKAAMDACDLAISLVGGGTEKQFRGGRKISLNERPSDVIREFLVGCNGRIAHLADGTVLPLVGVPDAIAGAFTDADVLATNELGTIPFPNLDEIINGATATYREPAQAWEDKETAPYLRADLEAEDDGRQQIEGLDLGTTFSGTQAQRVLKAVIEEGRRFRRHVVALPPQYAQFRPLQILAWTGDRFGYAAKRFLITARTVEPFGNVILGLQEVDPADHAWNPTTDQRPLSFAPVVTNRPAPQTVSAPSVAPVPGELAFDVFWSSTSVAVDVNFVRITYRLPGDDSTRITIPVPKPDLLLGAARVPVSVSMSRTTIEVQIEYISGSGRPMVASAWMEVTIADVRFGPGDLTDELRDTLEDITDFLDEDLPVIIDELDDIGADLAALAGAPNFVYGSNYVAGDLVRYAGGIYRAKVNNVDTLPTDPASWEKVGDYNSVAGTVVGFTARFEEVESRTEQAENRIVQTTRDTRRIQNALMAAAMLNSEQGQNQVLANTDQLAATATVSETVRTEVSRLDGTTTALAEKIEVVQATVENDVAEAISTVTTKVEAVDGRVTAEGQRLDALRAVIGDSAAEVLMKGEVMNGPGGPNSRWAIRLQTTNNGAVVALGMLFIDIIGGVATIGLQANRTVFYADDGTPFAAFADKMFRSVNGAFQVHMITGDLVSSGNFSFG